MPGIKRKTKETSTSKDVPSTSSRSRSTRNCPTSSPPSAPKSRKADPDDTESPNSTTSSSRPKTSDSSASDHKIADSEVSNAPISSSSSSNSKRRTTGKLDSNLNYSDTSSSSTSAEDSDDVYEQPNDKKKKYSRKVVPVKKEENSKDEKQVRTRAVKPKEVEATSLASSTSGQSTSSAVTLPSSSQLKAHDCSPSPDEASSSDEKEQEAAYSPKSRSRFNKTILNNVENWNSWYPDKTQLKKLAIEMNVDFKLAQIRMNNIRPAIKSGKIKSRVPLNAPKLIRYTQEQISFFHEKLQIPANWHPTMQTREEWAKELNMSEARVRSWLNETRGRAKEYQLKKGNCKVVSEKLQKLFSKMPIEDCYFRPTLSQYVVEKLRKKIEELGHWWPKNDQKLEWATELNVTYDQVTNWIRKTATRERKKNPDLVPSKPIDHLKQSTPRFTPDQIAYMRKMLKVVGLECRPTVDVSRKWAKNLDVYYGRVYSWWTYTRNKEMKETKDSEEDEEDDGEDDKEMKTRRSVVNQRRHFPEDVIQKEEPEDDDGEEDEEDVQNEDMYPDYDIDDYEGGYQNRTEDPEEDVDNEKILDEDTEKDNNEIDSADDRSFSDMEFGEDEDLEDGDESEEESDVEREETQMFPEIRKAHLFRFLRRSYKRDQNPTFQSIYEGRTNFGGSDTNLYNWYLQRKIRDGFVTRSASPGTNPADLTRNQRKFLAMVIDEVRESEVLEEIRIEEMEGWAGELGVEGTKVYEFIKEELRW